MINKNRYVILTKHKDFKRGSYKIRRRLVRNQHLIVSTVLHFLFQLIMDMEIVNGKITYAQVIHLKIKILLKILTSISKHVGILSSSVKLIFKRIYKCQLSQQPTTSQLIQMAIPKYRVIKLAFGNSTLIKKLTTN